jgi:hypothetical protein
MESGYYIIKNPIVNRNEVGESRYILF